MGNVITVKDHEGNDIKIEILTTFSIEKLNKNYIKMPFSLDKIKIKFKIIYLKNSLSKYLRSIK